MPNDQLLLASTDILPNLLNSILVHDTAFDSCNGGWCRGDGAQFSQLNKAYGDPEAAFKDKEESELRRPIATRSSVASFLRGLAFAVTKPWSS